MTIKAKVRLAINLKKAQDTSSYLHIANQLGHQFTGLDRNHVLTELARIGTEYAMYLWDRPEPNDLQIQESIQNVSRKARDFRNTLLHLGPVGRLIVYDKWLPDPENPPAGQLAEAAWTKLNHPENPGIDEPIRIIERQFKAFFESPEILWLMRIEALGEEWKPLWESYCGTAKCKKKPMNEAGQLLKDHCKWFLHDLRERGHEEKYQYPLSYHGLARKIHEAVTGKKAGPGQFNDKGRV